MKMISGKVLFSNPISLDKASKFLAKFVSAETEASQSNKAFLRRTSSAFNELNQQIKQLRPSNPDRKRKKQLEVVENDVVEAYEDVKDEKRVGSKGSLDVKNEINDSVREQGVVKKDKKKKKKKKKRGGEEESVEVKKEIGESGEKHGSKKKRIKSEKS